MDKTLIVLIVTFGLAFVMFAALAAGLTTSLRSAVVPLKGNALPTIGVLIANFVYMAVWGDEVPHLHVHLLPRLPGTPREYWGTRVSQWPQARRGNAAEIEVFVSELREYLAGSTGQFPS
jgi:hypothetical protein